MKKRLIGFGRGLLASIVFAFITLVVCGALVITIIGIPVAVIAALVGGFIVIVAPLYGFFDPDGLEVAIQKRRLRG